MKFYLSSYRIGNELAKLQELTKDLNKKVAYISNALDFTKKIERKLENERIDINQLEENGLLVDKIDLCEYFGKENELLNEIKEYDTIRVGGGNCFVLRQAFKLSGFDNILIKLSQENNKILYGGYSAGICILSPTLNGLDLVDDPNKFPYDNISKPIYEGLGVINFCIAPHYKSNHPESKAVNNIIEYYISNKILFKAVSDGEVLIIE